MTCVNEIPEDDGYYWAKRSPSWDFEIVCYYKGVVFIMGTNTRFSPYYDVYLWGHKIEEPK